ncbi:MAG: TonB-dependent receptor [Hyphomonadaceae bacterium]|nr:TonB-dependent receptor [Hyphomonadaceae bacterium]
MASVCGVSFFSLMLAANGAAFAQDASEELVVTGTRVVGINPVGSAVLDVGQAELQKNGNSSTADLLRQIPQVLSFGGNEGRLGGSGFQGDVVNVSFANGVNLRGIGTAATLSLVNNHRLPATGANSDTFEPDTIPSIAIQRIEIVADGASAIYGSDAVSGVVNYIMRQPFDGAEIGGRVGYANGGRLDWKTSAIFGTTWDSGGIMLAAERIHRDSLPASDRPELYNDNFSAVGGGNLPLFAAPGNIVTSVGTFGIPRGQAASLQLGELLSTPNRQSVWVGADALPETDSDSIVARFNQELFQGVELYGDVVYYKRQFSIRQNPTTQTITVPHTNPFSPCNAANAPTTNPYGITCTGTSLTVNYSLLYDLGPQIRSGYEDILSGTLGARIDLPYEWKADVYYMTGDASNSVLTTNSGLLAARATQLLAGPLGAIPAFNPFCDGSANCNSPVTMEYLRAFGSTNYTFDRILYSGSVSGPLFDLPGGKVRAAIGAEHYEDDFVNFNINNATGAYLPQPPTPNARDVDASFVEVYIPIFGEGNAVPGIQKLELSLAQRWEEYSDFGKTDNPKIGLTWVPVEGLEFHGSYGTSFHAPVLAANTPSAQAGVWTSAVNTVQTAALVSQGFLGTSPTYIPTGVIGGNGKLGPEEAETYSIGVEYEPSFVSGLRLSLNYYNVVYENVITRAASDAGATTALTNPAFAGFVYRNPTFWTQGLTISQSDYNALLAALVNNTAMPGFAAGQYDVVNRLILGPSPTPATSIAIIDMRRVNSGAIETDGLDFTASYDFETSLAQWRVGVVGQYVLTYDQQLVQGGPVDDLRNAYSGPLGLQFRAELSADFGQWESSLFLNYQSSYDVARRWIPTGASAEYEEVDAFTSFDASLTYRTAEGAPGPLQDIVVTLSMQNVFDETPPLMLNSSGAGIMYDSSRNGPAGRVTALTFRKAF